MSSFRFLHTYDVENSKIIPHLEKFQFSPEHRCFFCCDLRCFVATFVSFSEYLVILVFFWRATVKR